MDIYEIAGYKTGIERGGVNFLDPIDAFEFLENGYIYRQELQSRKGFRQFSNRLGDQGGDVADFTRVLGIFNHIHPDGTIEILAITKKYLYAYDPGTNIFNQVPNNSSVPFVDFAIISNDDYVSGTSYPFPNGDPRFIFTGKGMTDTYFYDGTDVKRFTNVADNPTYVAPPIGALTNATYVNWFGERLNLYVPSIVGVPQKQMVLYSGIRTTGGNGDNFNVAGAGDLSADTFQYMTGAIIAGDYIVLNFNESNWTIEKTRDAFNPYFIRKVPSDIGTDAQFSGVTWSNQTLSMGKTGLIVTDGRQQLRIDDKLPYFTADDISAADFNLTYGGFDRINSQYLFAFRSSTSNLTPVTQDKVLVRNYKENTWSINDQRFSCFGQTTQGINLVWDDIDETEDVTWGRMDTTEDVWNRIGIGEEVKKTLAGDNDSFIYEINSGFDDYFVPISAITAASSAVLTLDPSAFQIGDRVVVENAQGMTEINGVVATVTAATTTSVTLTINSTNFTAYTTGGTLSKLINFYAELSPFNPYRDQGRMVFVSHVEVLINTNGGNIRMDFWSDEEETPFKADVLLQPTVTTKAREWITCTVNQEANFITMALKQESVTNQVIVTSIRIHCSMGGLTSA